MPTIYKNSLAYSQTVAYGGFTPVGTVISVMGNDTPTNYLKCDGTVYNISAYPDLAAYFSAQFGQANKFGGDGTTTFAVPDLRGEFLRGTGTNGHTNQGDGATVGTHQDATAHVDGYFYNVGGQHNMAINNPLANNSIEAANKDAEQNVSGAEGKQYWTAYGSNAASDRSTYYTSRPTNTSVLYCIAYKNIYIENGGGGTGSSGHTIVDTDGNDMPEEDGLQFIGLLVQDDSTNGVTTVEAEGLNSDSLDDVLDGSIGNEIINNGMTYSTNEQVVGKWIDGKPIYQKTFTSTLPNATTNGTIVYDYIDAGAQIDTVVEQKGKFHTLVNGLWHDVVFDMDINNGPNYAVKALVCDNSASSHTNTIIIGNADTAWNGAPLHVTIQYTKAS